MFKKKHLKHTLQSNSYLVLAGKKIKFVIKTPKYEIKKSNYSLESIFLCEESTLQTADQSKNQ